MPTASLNTAPSDPGTRAGRPDADTQPLVMAIDTTTPVARLALVTNGEPLARLADDSGTPHSQTLFPNLDRLLTEAGADISAIDIFAAVTGPGSFTGLRVGLAALRGLAHTLGRPGIGVTTIDATALAAGAAGLVIVALEATRGEIFCGARLLELHGADLIPRSLWRDCSVLPEAALAELAPLYADQPALVIGSAAARMRKLWAVPAWQFDTAPVETTIHVARYAARLFRDGQTPPLDACYIRPADATLKS
ncbi:MAG: tRNA (adenosine(37)-N6)-threonylcarbamoyltransferase complex dimerization subunit type 1 TsaB [Blastocatellia bacterium]